MIIYKGVKYLSLNAQIDDEYNFIIYDMGVIEHKNINAIKNKCDVAILCTTAKPYEIKSYDEAKALLDDDNAHTIFSFVQDNAKIEIQNKYKQVFFAEYSPELFDSEKNQDIWEKILENHIVINGNKY